MSKVDRLIIGIGSSQKSHEPDNPFTAGERLTMLERALDEVATERTSWIPVQIPDAEGHSQWVSIVRMLCPVFQVVFSNDPLTTELFRENSVDVQTIPFLDRVSLSSTEVRRRMVSGGDWALLVPNSIASFITQIDGVGRLRRLAQ